MSKNHQNLHPREQAITNLIKKLKQKIKNGFEIILMLDANDTIKTHKGIISKLQHTCHFHVVQSKSQPNLNSYKRGKSQIDFFMVTPFIKKFITSFVIQSFDYICRSDHRAMLIAIDITQLIQILTNNNNYNSRAIQSSTPKQISLYKKFYSKKCQTMK